ncbi:MAG TPA: DUF1697 domain-containing protein [Gemmatimonadaceae bacterium]|nr:DUF1697 domain-containing protein [Gemmatimonadaceae bacterium]
MTPAKAAGRGVQHYAALLRGINVGGNKKIAMAELRAMAAKLGLENPLTLLQSGNLVFATKSQPIAKLEQILEDATLSKLGVECSYLVRTGDEWSKIMAANPYPDMAKSDPSRLVVTFCRERPDADALNALRKEARGGESLEVVGRELFIRYPDGMGTSKLATALSRNRLGTICSARNWNTVVKIAEALK